MSRLHRGDVRKLHPDEILASFSFKPHEMPRFAGKLNSQYTAVCQTVCVNVVEALAAEALAAMGKHGPRDELRRRLTGAGMGRADAADVGDNAVDEGELPPWLERRTSAHGVMYHKYVALAAMDECAPEEEDRLLITWNGEGDGEGEGADGEGDDEDYGL